MADILSAASMLLAVLAIMFGMWGPEISKAASADNLFDPKSHRDKYEGCKSLFRTKAIPLTVFALILTAIFFPNAVGIIVSSYKNYRDKGIGGLWDYNPVTTSVVAVTIISGGLAFYLVATTIKLKGWLNTNNPDK